MLQSETYQKDRREDLLFAVALCLIVAVVLEILGAIFKTSSFSGISGRERVELISEEAANILTGAFALGAVVALSFLSYDRITRARPLVVLTLIVGTVVALLATYSVVDVLTVHIPSVNSDASLSVGLIAGPSFADRLGTTLPQLAAVFIALVAMVGGNRLGAAPGDT